MSLRLECECGATLAVAEMYAGGRIRCDECGTMVTVPERIAPQTPVIRFSCPHCAEHVVARKASAGKRSHCPACGETYSIPALPPAEPEMPLGKRQRVEIKLDDVYDYRQTNELVDGGTLFPLVDLNADTSLSNGGDTAVFHDGHTTVYGSAHSTAAPTEPAEIVPGPEVVTPKETSWSSFADSAVTWEIVSAEYSGIIEAELLYCSGNLKGQSFPINREKFLIGRERDCQLQPESETINLHHCVLRSDAYAVRVRDLGSRCGTFVNGRRLHREVILYHSDMIRIGDVSLRLILPRSEGHEVFLTGGLPSLDEFSIR